MKVSTFSNNMSLSQSLLFLYLSTLLVAVCLVWLLVSSKKAGLSHIPGPFLARYIDAWSLFWAWRISRRGGKVDYYRRLQAQYGDVVRIGPCSVVVLNPAAVPAIYGVRAKLDKVSRKLQVQGQEVSLISYSGPGILTLPPSWRNHKSHRHQGREDSCSVPKASVERIFHVGAEVV